jgi:hypothetical protein
VADDLGVGWAFLEDREKTAGNAQSLKAFRLWSLAGAPPLRRQGGQGNAAGALGTLWRDRHSRCTKTARRALGG